MRTILSCLLVAAAVVAQSDLQPEQPLSDTQQGIVNEGVRLHDQGKYEEALERYRMVIAQNPANSTAWYEMSFTYSMLKQWPKCIESARAGMVFDSPRRTPLIMLVANCHDSAGDAPAAIETYQSLIAAFPPGATPRMKALVYFNLGITYGAQNEGSKAREQFKTAIQLYPRYASSHMRLAEWYSKTNDRIPALLALGVFLCLEPVESPRRATAIESARRIMTGFVTKVDDKSTNITLPEGDPKNPEGDFTAEAAMLGILGAGQMMEKSQKPPSEFARYETLWKMLLSVMLGEDRRKELGGTFAAKAYLPFYDAIVSHQFTGAFVSQIFAPSALPASKEEKAALEKATEFRQWLAAWGK